MSLFQTTISTRTVTATAVVIPDAEPAFRARTSSRPMNSPGTVSDVVIPKKSFNCVLAMTSAMPFVKPMTTGRGMNRTAVPVPVIPMMNRTSPAIIVDMYRPSMP